VVSFSVRGFLKSWLPVFLWLAVIFISSTDLMSVEHTSRFIGPFLRWFAPDISDAAVASTQIVVRKCAHLTEYAILAALLCRALRPYLDRTLAALLVLVIAAGCAALDEYHQSFVASRTASPWDVLIDCAGALAGIALFRHFVRRHRPRFEIRNSKYGIH
jgi:VanZ family protein